MDKKMEKDMPMKEKDMMMKDAQKMKKHPKLMDAMKKKAMKSKVMQVFGKK